MVLEARPCCGARAAWRRATPRPSQALAVRNASEFPVLGWGVERCHGEVEPAAFRSRHFGVTPEWRRRETTDEARRGASEPMSPQHLAASPNPINGTWHPP